MIRSCSVIDYLAERNAMSSPVETPTGHGPRRMALVWITIGAVAVIIAVIVVTIGVAMANNGLSPASVSTTTPGAGEPGGGATASPGSTPAPPQDSPAPGDEPFVTASPLPFAEAAEPAPGVTVSVGTFEAVQGEAQLAGDVAGPAIRFTVSIVNGTGKAISLATALVNVYYGADQSPASELQKPGGSPLPAEVAAGATVTGTMVFTVPEEERDHVLITMDYQVGDPVLAFEGAIPN